MITVKQRGDFKNLDRYLKKSLKRGLGMLYKDKLEKYAQQGVEVLAANTPLRTGLTASSWQYEIEIADDGSSVSIVWSNRNIQGRYANIALLLQYGHATRNGGYVTGIDYINPSLQPIFDKMANAAWKEVSNI